MIFGIVALISSMLLIVVAGLILSALGFARLVP
jgi:hypothetical protein